MSAAGSHPDDRLDRYVRGELAAAESRQLAQQSLDAPELFEELTVLAIAKSGLASRSIPRGTILPFRSKMGWMTAAAVAAVVLLSLLLLRNSPSSNRLVPALSLEAKPGQPLLLAAGLGPEPARSAEVFRGIEAAGRSPRPSGAITATEGGMASIDLGSLDGIAKGSELAVFPEEASAQPEGRLIVTAVFRESARGRLVEGHRVQVSHRVRVSSAVHMEALLDQATALYARGDSDAARKIVKHAANLADTAIPASERRQALERLAAIEYRLGILQEAEMHYRAAVDLQDGSPVASNNLAVLYALRGEYKSAEAVLRRMPPASSTPVMRGNVANNLGVLAELRGNRHAAEMHYADAAQAFANAEPAGEERRAVETNLARIRGSR